MYLLFLHKSIRPMDYYMAGPGERRVLRAFMLQELEDKKKASEGGK